jgi:hypothetical protein
MTIAEEIFKEIAAVKWHKIKDSGGTPQNIPRYFHAIRYGTPEEQEEYYDHLGETLFHQQTHYAVTPIGVRFIIKFLADPEMPIKSHLLYLLADIAHIENQLLISPLTEQSLQAIEAAAPLVRQLAQDADADTRHAATILLQEIAANQARGLTYTE